MKKIIKTLMLLCTVISTLGFYSLEKIDSKRAANISQKAGNLNAQEKFPKDFDFLLGKWKIHNKILKQRLSDSKDEWVEFKDAEAETWKLLDGMVIIDQFYIVMNGNKIIGSNYRIYNSKTKEWTISWASPSYSDRGLMFQVKGSFDNGVGKFFGEEDFNGKKVKLRFLWKKTNSSEPVWEQAYYDEKNKRWETNWVMSFTKID